MFTDQRTLPGPDSNLATSHDLRRRTTRRDVALLIAQRAAYLDESERYLVSEVYEHGRSVTDVARALSVSPRSMRRRLTRAVRRATDPLFGYVLAARHSWSPTRRRVAEACFLRGLAARRAAAELGVTYHVARRHVEEVRLLFGATRA